LGALAHARQGTPLLDRVEDKFSMIMMLDIVVPVPLVGDAAVQTAGLSLNT